MYRLGMLSWRIHEGGRYIYKSGHITLDNIWVHDTALAAVWSDDNSNITIENSRFWLNNNTNDPTNPLYKSNMWMGALVPRGSADASAPYATNIVIRKNEIFNQYGECINVHGRVSGVTIEDNVIYNCWAPAIYYPNSKDILIQRNLVYHTNDSRFLRGGNPSAGIGSQKEDPPTRPGEMRNIKIINNFVKGFASNFFFWGYIGGYLEDTLVAHNTFVDAHSNPNGRATNINIGTGAHVNTKFENNIVIQDDVTGNIGNSSGRVQFSNNLWSKTPPSNMQGAGDMVVDPKIARTGSTAAGKLSADYFRISGDSPVINKAKVLSIAEDYFGNKRNSPDIGAHEYNGVLSGIKSGSTSTTVPTVRSTVVPTKVLAVAGEVSNKTSIIVDHNSVAKFDSLTNEDVSRATAIRLILRRASVGGNVSDGLDSLFKTNSKYNRTKWSFQSRGNPSWQTKISDLTSFTEANLSSYDVFSMKFCYIDPSADFITYKNAMVSLMEKYPTKKFVWWTMPITTSKETRYEIFNNKVREYAKTNSGVILFDIADIEAHDTSGNMVKKDGSPVLVSSYTSDGGHLNSVGSARVAKAFWYLMANISNPTNQVTTMPTSIPTLVPTSASQNNCTSLRLGGDADCNGDVDVLDYALWHKQFFDGNRGEIVKNNWEADLTGPVGDKDGKVDTYDYSLWYQKFWETL